MPQIIIKGLDVHEVKKINIDLIHDLSVVMNCPEDHFILECVQSVFLAGGIEIKTYPLIEIKWFDRGSEIKQETVNCLTRHIRTLNYADVEVFFTALKPEDYFENGVSFG